jgi:hypothetical protein
MEIEPEVGIKMDDVMQALIKNKIISTKTNEDGSITYSKLVDGFGSSYTFSNEHDPYSHLLLLARTRFYDALKEKLGELDFNQSHADRELFVAFHLERSIDHARRKGIISQDTTLPNTNTLVEAIVDTVESYLDKFNLGREIEPLHRASMEELAKSTISNVVQRSSNIIFTKPIQSGQLQSIIVSTFYTMHNHPSYKNAQLLSGQEQARSAQAPGV